MAVSTLLSNAISIRPSQHSGMGHRLMRGQEGSSQDFTVGAPLIRSSGYLVEASADPVADIVGVAAGNSTGTQGAECLYWPATPDFVYEATLEDQSNENHALVITNMFTDYALQVDSSNNWYVDENDTTNTCVCIVGVKNNTDITNATVRSRVLFVFLEDTTVYNT